MEYTNVKRFIENYNHDFQKYFNADLSKFLGILAVADIPDFDIVKFDEFLHKEYGYNEEEHGSMKNFVTERFGEDASNLIIKLISCILDIF